MFLLSKILSKFTPKRNKLHLPIITLFKANLIRYRGKRGNVKQNFSSVSQDVYIANMAIFMYSAYFGVNTFK